MRIHNGDRVPVDALNNLQTAFSDQFTDFDVSFLSSFVAQPDIVEVVETISRWQSYFYIIISNTGNNHNNLKDYCPTVLRKRY